MLDPSKLARWILSLNHSVGYILSQARSKPRPNAAASVIDEGTRRWIHPGWRARTLPSKLTNPLLSVHYILFPSTSKARLDMLRPGNNEGFDVGSIQVAALDFMASVRPGYLRTIYVQGEAGRLEWIVPS